MLKEQIKNGLIHGITIFLTVCILTIGYASITNVWTNTDTLEVSSGSTLSATSWNKLLGNFEFLKSKTENISSNGANVGIGTNTPITKLEVSGNFSVKGGEVFVQRPTVGGGWARGLHYVPDGSTNSTTQGLAGIGVYGNDTSEHSMYLTFGPAPWSSDKGIQILANGNVGIGMVTPGQKLSVAGTIESTTGGFKFPDGTIQNKAFQGIVNVRTNSIGSFSLAHGGSVSYSANCLAGEIAIGGGCMDGGYKDFYYWIPGSQSYTCGWYNTSGATRNYAGAVVYVSCLK